MNTDIMDMQYALNNKIPKSIIKDVKLNKSISKKVIIEIIFGFLDMKTTKAITISEEIIESINANLYSGPFLNLDGAPR